MARQGNDAAFSELSRRAERHLRAGMVADYTDDLRRMASVLHEEGRYHDELKVRMLDFHVMLTFLDFYHVLLRFVLYRLYLSAGMRYPPSIDALRDCEGAEIDALTAEIDAPPAETEESRELEGVAERFI